jgi:CHAD domain-containing protein
VAKARDIPGLHGEVTFAKAAAATVAVRADELFEHSSGVLDTAEIERVHAMRVASRRLRAVLEIYAPCFPRKAHKSVLADVKALADALGARRDPDVQLAALDRFVAAAGDAEGPGIAVFAERLRTEQRLGNETLSAALAHANRTDLRGRLHVLAAAAAAADGKGRGA